VTVALNNKPKPVAAVSAAPRLMLVGQDIARHTAYLQRKLPPEHPNALRKVTHGIYITAAVQPDWVFATYALRVNLIQRPNSVIAFSTAFFRRPTFGRVFVVGDYQYRQDMLEDGEKYLIVQSRGIRLPNDPRVQEEREFTDPMGTFKAWIHTPEMVLLNSFNATKRHSEKHLAMPELQQLLAIVIRRAGGRGHAIAALESIAAVTDRQAEFRSVVNFITTTNESPRSARRPRGES
jgi:hypothetical protein